MPSGISAQRIGSLSPAAQAIAAAGSQAQGYVTQFTPGSYSFTPTKAGYWKFVGWGPGGGSTGANPAASGAYFEKTVFLSITQTVAIVVADGAALNGPTTLTFPNGLVVSATSGQEGNNPGVATGGDVNLNGSNPGSAGLGTGGGAAPTAGGTGAGAPAMLPFRGGRGPNGLDGSDGKTPGGGAQLAALSRGADGEVTVFFVRP